MKLLFTKVVVLFGCLSLAAQTCPTNRYVDAIFNVTKQSNVVFGNAPTLTPVYVGESVTINQDLTMDIFLPTGDTASKRPLIIFAFGGGYIFGTKDDSDIQGLCDYFARRGYVTASINYRKGLNAASETSALRAIYRGAQDWSSAVRWFKEFSTTYKVDTNYIFAGGSSAGSFGALHMAYAEESDKPDAANASGFPSFNPDLGCLSCSGNNYAHSNRVKAILNCWGALLNKNFVDASDDIPIISVHGMADPIVPYNSGSPFSASLIIQSVDGSSPIHQRALQVGNPSKLIAYPDEGHCVWGICINNGWAPGSPTQFYNPILDSLRVYMYPYLQPTPVSITGPATPMCVGDTAVYFVNGSNATRYCWQVNGATVIELSPTGGAIKVIWNTTGQLTVTPYSHLGAAGNATTVNTTVSSYPAQPLISQQGDTLSTPNDGDAYTYQWYLDGVAISGATGNTHTVADTGNYTVEITNLGGCAATSAPIFAQPTIIIEEPNGLAENSAAIKLYPNPNSGVFVIEGLNQPQIVLYNSVGQLCSVDISYSNNTTTLRHNLPKGIYYLKVTQGSIFYANRFVVE